MNKKKIDYRFKILYAVAILMVVAGHCDGGGISLDFAQWFPYEGIHLALFTFCSGYFFKDAASYPDTSNVWVYDCVWAACQVITSVGLSNRWKI